MAKVLGALLLVTFALPGCSSFSDQARVQKAHEKYVRKMRREHTERTVKATEEANRPLREPAALSEPVTTVTLEPLESENIVTPIVVKSDAEAPAP
jgi:hypothetical protein